MGGFNFSYAIMALAVILILMPAPAAAFGAGNIASISAIEGKNWRHGDIEDMLKTVAFLKGHKWSSMMIKRVYFGNWLRDYSQAVDVGTLKGVPADTIRVLIWILAFMSFGYATGEFEVTSERLGTYRPEEHIDNPKDYADNIDARKFDPRLRPPVEQIELDIDPQTGMKNYIANDSGGWATSSGYVRHSFTRAIHFGRVYQHGASGTKGREEDLCEALRCLGQALHTLEDFGAHSNYVELALIEMGHRNIFPHVGAQAEVNIRGKRLWPLVTGTFGGVDFLHSVLGEATDHITQSEVDEVNTALLDATTGGAGGKRSGESSSGLEGLVNVLGQVPGTGDFVHEARRLQQESDHQAAINASSSASNRGYGNDAYDNSRAPGDQERIGGINVPTNVPDPAVVIQKIYPILLFRDRVVRGISAIVSKIPGLENLIETITERVTLFVLSLLAPFVIPVIKAASASLKTGSSTVIDASGKHQFEVWTNPQSTDPTHSMLSKDHFSNILNEPAGQVATVVLQYVAPRVIYAWDHPDIPVEQVLNDVVRVFHHPALRDHNLELHRDMFAVVEKFARSRSDLDRLLSSDSVKAGRNHIGGNEHLMQGGGGHAHHGPNAGAAGSGFGLNNLPNFLSGNSNIPGLGSHSKVSGSPFEMFNRKRDLGEFGGGEGSAGGSYGGQSSSGYGGGSSAGYQQQYDSQSGYQGAYHQENTYPGNQGQGSGGYYNPPSQDQGGYGGQSYQQGPYGRY